MYASPFQISEHFFEYEEEFESDPMEEEMNGEGDEEMMEEGEGFLDEDEPYEEEYMKINYNINMDETMIKLNGNNIDAYHLSRTYSFWIRRMIDQSAESIYNTIIHYMKLFDLEWLEEANYLHPDMK